MHEVMKRLLPCLLTEKKQEVGITIGIKIEKELNCPFLTSLSVCLWSRNTPRQFFTSPSQGIDSPIPLFFGADDLLYEIRCRCWVSIIFCCQPNGELCESTSVFLLGRSLREKRGSTCGKEISAVWMTHISPTNRHEYRVLSRGVVHIVSCSCI